LATGDYSIRTADRDYRDLISVERKSLPDLFGCVGQQRERFERCLERLATYPYCAIVIEATFADILSGARHSQVHPNSALGSIVSWGTKYRIPIWLCGDRANAAMVVGKILTKAVRYIEADKGMVA
jgi:ERCC4-type nuclease